jgi:ribosomal protein L37AE/L43A
MRNHVLRPLWVVIGAISLLLLVRHFMVPGDFGVHGEKFAYGYYRLSNIAEWRDFKVKHRGQQYCADCHLENVEQIAGSVHAAIQCESCHGPALDHPEDPARLTIDTGRLLCLRCHAALPTPGSERSNIAAIDPAGHNPGMECVTCHAPHNPSLEDLR